MMSYSNPRGHVLAVLLVSLAGCFSLSRDTPALEQFVLGGAPRVASADSSRDPYGRTIGLRRLDLAPYLDVPAVLVRRGAHQIVVSEFHRWSESPADGINRTVAAYLAAAGPFRAVAVAPWPVGSRYDYLIQLRVSRFEGVAPVDSMVTEGGVRVVASWEILRQPDGVVQARGTTDHQMGGWRVGDYGGLVALLDSGLNRIAHDLATCLATLATASARVGDLSTPVTDNGSQPACEP